MSVAHANGLYGAEPVEIAPDHAIVLIRINRTYRRGMPDVEIYEATRKWWKIDKKWCRVGDPRAPRWALGVFQGVVRGVYRIESWEQPTAEDIAADPTDTGRWGFRGAPDSDMKRIYLHRNVSRYLTSQSPLRFEGRCRLR
jgi:hypothetical protein